MAGMLADLWQDIKFDVKHFGDIERLAMVGEKKWEQWMATFCKPFTTATVKYFPQGQSAEAQGLDGPEISQPRASAKNNCGLRAKLVRT